jgi:hypothetical protein
MILLSNTKRGVKILWQMHYHDKGSLGHLPARASMGGADPIRGATGCGPAGAGSQNSGG